MSDTLNLPAETRERAGKGASRALRREGRVPAVVYGNNEAPVSIHVEEKELRRQLGTGHFFNSIVEIELGGQKVRTLPKDVAFHPVNDRPLHADFLRISKDSVVHVDVPVAFINEEKSPGLKKGGILNVVRHELEMICSPDSIPDDIIVDVRVRQLLEREHDDVTGGPVADDLAVGQGAPLPGVVVGKGLEPGEGVAADQLTGLFEPFARAENSRNRASGGTGLGLTIARAIARAHGGDVILENRSEGGLRAILRVRQ